VPARRTQITVSSVWTVADSKPSSTQPLASYNLRVHVAGEPKHHRAPDGEAASHDDRWSPGGVAWMRRTMRARPDRSSACTPPRGCRWVTRHRPGQSCGTLHRIQREPACRCLGWIDGNATYARQGARTEREPSVHCRLAEVQTDRS